MTSPGDLELERLFGGEVDERSYALATGARVLVTGEVTDGLLQDMCREGHTIKGTARMMGFSAVSDAGKLLEDAWGELRDGEQIPDQALADALEALSLELLPALAADPATGTPALAEGMRALRQAMRGDAIPLQEPVTRATSEPSDLGGLLGTLDFEGFGETIRVNAAALFRLINEICSLRVDAEALHSAVGQMEDSIGDQAGFEVSLTSLNELVATAEKAVIDVQNRAVDLAAAPLSEITSTYPQLVRYLARKAGKDVRFEIVGEHHQVDRQVLERISDPLRHLLANAINHGVELPAEREALGKPPTATLAVGFDVVDHRLTISVEDDGSGIDWAMVREMATQRGLLDEPESRDLESLRSVLFSPHFSTAQPGEMVGDGMGLATVAEAVEALHGTFVLKSEAGSGTRLTITVPTSHALQDAVIIRAAGQMWGIPEISVIDRVPTDSAEFVETPSRTEMIWNGTTVPVTSFAEVV